MKGLLAAILAVITIVFIATPASAQYALYGANPVWYSTAPVYSTPVYTIPGVIRGPAYVAPSRLYPTYIGGPVYAPGRPVVIRGGLFGRRVYLLE